MEPSSNDPGVHDLPDNLADPVETTKLDRWYCFVVTWAPVFLFLAVECWLLVQLLNYFL